MRLLGRPKLYKTQYKNLKRTTKRARPNTLYYGDFTIKKKRFYPPLGDDEEEARKKLVEIMAEKRKELSREKIGTGKLSDVQRHHRQKFAETVGRRQLKSWETRDRTACKVFKDCHVGKLQSREIRDWVLARSKVRKPSTVNADLTRLKQVLKHAVELGHIEQSPAKSIKLLPLVESRVRYLLEHEETALRECSTEEEFAWFEFAFLTGLRQGEQLGLKWEDIVNGKIILDGTHTKSKKNRTIPIRPRVQEILDSRRGLHKNLVWASPKGLVWDPINFRRRFWKPIHERAGIDCFTWHDLRHTFCTRLVAKGANLAYVGKLAGHKDFKTTQIYAHFSPDFLRETMALLD